jgi:hypothetical protein
MECHHLDLQKSFIAIIKEILGFAAVDANHSEQELSTQAKSHEFDVLTHNCV